MKVTGVYKNDPTKRQIAESVKIKSTKGTINRRDEWRTINIPRVEFTLNLNQD